ncbi:MAG: MIP/aquaporin family protein [bacterium]|nr:MIP/aquaporin family protein [bacterium]
MTTTRRYVAEFLGTAFLLMAVVGSGIMAQRMFADTGIVGGGNGVTHALTNDGLMLLANAIATGGALVALIVTFGSISGAHFNPAVTLSMLLQRRMQPSIAALYVVAQITGAIVGVACSHWMFDMPTFVASSHVRSGTGVLFAECVATFGLIAVVMACSRRAPSHDPSSTPTDHHYSPAPFAVAAYIVAAYWFTSSTSFANPAVTLARGLTDSFAGIRMQGAPLFVVAQVASATVATFVMQWLLNGKGNRT